MHSQSRGVVISLDAARRKASLVRQITRPAALLAESQGNMQALANGDWLIGWGEIPDVSEFSADGRLLFDAHLPAADESYRALDACSVRSSDLFFSVPGLSLRETNLARRRSSR